MGPRASPGCRRFGAISYPVAEPPGATSLIWDNPEGFLQADIFFSRGNRAYRITVVPPGPANQVPSRVDGGRLLATPQQIACQLRDAGCDTPPAATEPA